MSERMLNKRERQRAPKLAKRERSRGCCLPAALLLAAGGRRNQPPNNKPEQIDEESSRLLAVAAQASKALAQQPSGCLLERLNAGNETENSKRQPTTKRQLHSASSSPEMASSATIMRRHHQSSSSSSIMEEELSGRRQQQSRQTGGSSSKRRRRGQQQQRQLAQLASLPFVLLVVAAVALVAVAGTRSPPSTSGGASQPVAPARRQQQPQEQEKQLQLLRSANVELSRRSLQRLQRDTTPGDSTAVTASVPSSGQQQQQQPTCGYPGSPAHASVTFNTSLVVAGTAASYTCDNGYELLGPPRRLCQANGTWSPVGIPFCVLNVGLGKAAMQSSTAGHGSAQKAVDGSTSPYFQASTCTMTDVEHNPWWYVNLLEPYLVQIVRIDFGTACCANRQKATIAVRVGNNRPDLGNNPLCNRYHGFIEEGKPLFLPCTRPAPGAFVSIHLESPSGSALSICETFIYTDHALSIEQCPSFRDQPLGSTATYNGKCYLFHNNQALSFDGARKYCESRGGTLVDETSPALQGFLSWELYRRHRNDQLMGQYWLGAVRDTRNPANWKWINGKDVQISFWNSLANQGNCSRFDGSKGWLWTDTDCATNLNFICQYRPLSCGKPEKPTNSTLITKNIDNGTVIEYQCAPGNLLMGPKSRACLPTGFFSEFAPKCKYLDCQFPAMIPNGDYKLLNSSTSYQSVVHYFCNDGFQIYGKATLTCDVDERWNGPPPRCEPLLCSAPVPPSNGYVTVTSNITVPGTQATYDCRPGYELVGDRLLTCSPAGSWDNSFPYCREKRALAMTPLLVGQSSSSSAPGAVVVATSTTAAPVGSSPNGSPRPAQEQRPPQQQQQPNGAGPKLPTGGAVQFPAASATSPFSSNRIGSSSTLAPSTSTVFSAASLPASLNGLAGQFAQSSFTPAATQQSADSSSPAAATEQQTRKAAQSNSVSQFIVPPPPPASSSSSTPQSLDQQTQRTRPQSPSPTSTTLAAAISQSFTQPPPPAPSSSASSSAPSGSGSRQQTTTSAAANKFTFVGIHQQQTTPANAANGQPQISSSGAGFDSTPLAATTNSISVHGSQQQQQQPSVNSVLASSVTGSGSGSSTTGATPVPTTTALHNAGAHQQHHHQHHQHHHQNVLASLSPPIRSHNTLANAKYSLDGIIAVAIFGGFIFLGAIITIIVIIIRRRKSGHSSTIDAQTISTYDSNGEHNGLYRNYQQAWENLRFATPSSQPKSSGNADVSLITAHINGGPSVGLKNFSAPSVAMLQHQHQLHHHGHQHHLHHHPGAHHLGGGGGAHNLAMSDSASSSQSSSSLGGTTADPPLLRGHHAATNSSHNHHHHHHHHNHSAGHHHHHHHQQQQHHEHEVVMHDEELDDEEQGVLSSDEANYRAGGAAAVDQLQAEGFRDTNELTINADTVLGTRSSQQAAAARRSRLYSAATEQQRLSANLSMASAELYGNHQHQQQHNHHHQSHHHQHHHLAAAGSSSSQHQRLVSSSTPSTSTRSSRASPPSDDQSLDRLAYGNSWHPNGGGGAGQSTSGGQRGGGGDDSASSGNNSASGGSGASILGAGRANLRYN